MEKRPWGGSKGVAVDRDGKSVWATDRCSPGIAPGCPGTKANPVHLFDESGNAIRSSGGGLFVWPQGIHVDRDGKVWVTDARVATAEERIKFPSEDNKGSVVVKFSPDGKVLMTLGKPGVEGDPPDALTEPNDVVTDPSNGDVYTRRRAIPTSRTRISSAVSRGLIVTASFRGSSARLEPVRENSARHTPSSSSPRAG